MFRQNSIQLLTQPVRTCNLYTRGFRSKKSVCWNTRLALPCYSPADSPTVKVCERATDEMWPTSGPTTQGNHVPEVCVLTPYGAAFINRLNRYCDVVVFGNFYRRIELTILIPEWLLNGDLVVLRSHSHGPSHGAWNLSVSRTTQSRNSSFETSSSNVGELGSMVCIASRRRL